MSQMLDAITVGLTGSIIDKIFGLYKRLSFPVFKEEIFFPGQNSALHFGFVNCINNERGLRAKFYACESNFTGCHWESINRKGLDGYPGIIHGGVISSLMDELFTYSVFDQTKKFGVTYQLTMEFNKPLSSTASVIGSAKVIKIKGNFVKVIGTLFDSERKKPFATAKAVFYLPTYQQFQKIVGKENDISEFVNFLRTD